MAHRLFGASIGKDLEPPLADNGNRPSARAPTLDEKDVIRSGTGGRSELEGVPRRNRPRSALLLASRELDGDYTNGDLLVMTDGVFSVDERLLEKYQSFKERMDFLCHVLLVGDFASVPSEEFADVFWRWSTGEDFELGAAQMIKSLRRRTGASHRAVLR